MSGLPSREDVMSDFGAWLADDFDTFRALSPRQAAQEALVVQRGEATVEEIEDVIRADRGLAPKYGKPAA